MARKVAEPHLQYLILAVVAVEIAAVDWWLIRTGRRTLSDCIRANPKLHYAVRHLEGHLTRDMAIDVLKFVANRIPKYGANL